MKEGKAPPSGPILPGGDQPTIVLFGDSHTDSVRRALRSRSLSGQPRPVLVFRQVKEKNGRVLGNISFEDFLGRISKLGRNDVVLSMIGGSQHAVFSTVQHPRAFDFYTPYESPPPAAGAEIIPFRGLNAFFAKSVIKGVALAQEGHIRGDGSRIVAVRAATKARVVHVLPPPPLRDSESIARRHENLFADGLAEFGVSPPELRLKFWSLQARILQKFCQRHGVEVMAAPREAVEGGFLRSEYHEAGAHANERYGELLLRSLEARFLVAD